MTIKQLVLRSTLVAASVIAGAEAMPMSAWEGCAVGCNGSYCLSHAGTGDTTWCVSDGDSCSEGGWQSFFCFLIY